MLSKKRRSPWALDEGICGREEGKVERILNPDTGWKWDSCRELFKNLELFPLQSLFILLLFVVKNRELFTSNCDIRNVNTRYNVDLHLPKANLTVFQKGFFFYFGIRVFNILPSTVRDLSYDVKQFKLALKRFFLANPFSCLEEYFD
jgi:hypothetical protein